MHGKMTKRFRCAPGWQALTMLILVSAVLIWHPPHAAAQDPTPVEIIVQMGPDVGQSVGVLSRAPNNWPSDHSSTVLPFGNYYGRQSGAETYARTYLWFPLPDPPVNHTLEAAYIELYSLDDWPFQGQATFGLYAVTEGWTEGMSWDQRAAVDERPISTAGASSQDAATWVRWDATALVSAWASGTPNYGALIAALPIPDAPPDASGNWALAARGRIDSDPTLAPRLILRYLPVATPTPTAMPTSPPPSPTPLSPTAAPPPTAVPTAVPPIVPTAVPTATSSIMLLPVSGASSILWEGGALMILCLCLIGGGLLFFGRDKRA